MKWIALAVGRYSPVPTVTASMWEINEGELVRYRCHVGHAYTAEIMSVALDENLKRSFDIALRALDRC